MASDATQSAPERGGRAATAVGYLPATLAGGAVALYILGIVASVGAFRAANLDPGDVLARVPLEVHLRNGIGALTDPVMWVGLLLLGLMVVYVAADAFNLGIEAPPGQPPRPLAVALGYCVVLSPLLFFQPWPDALLIAPSGLLLFAPLLLLKLRDRLPKRTLIGLFGVLAVLSVLLVGAADSYFRSDPPPTATVRLADQVNSFEAPLIATDGALVYLGPREGTKAASSYQAIPNSRIARMTLTREERKRDEPSVTSLLWPW